MTEPKYTLELCSHNGIISVQCDGMEIARSIDHHNAKANAEVKAALEALICVGAGLPEFRDDDAMQREPLRAGWAERSMAVLAAGPQPESEIHYLNGHPILVEKP